jgi:hypothetical protein
MKTEIVLYILMVATSYWTMFRLPALPTPWLGYIRAAAAILIMLWSAHLNDNYNGWVENLVVIFSGICFLNIFVCMFVCFGMTRDDLNEKYTPEQLESFRKKNEENQIFDYINSSGFNSIDEALDFRDGVLNQKTTSEKTKEMAKTAFVTKNALGNMASMSENEKEALTYLNGVLNQYPTSQKYEKLKEFFGNK